MKKVEVLFDADVSGLEHGLAEGSLKRELVKRLLLEDAFVDEVIGEKPVVLLLSQQPPDTNGVGRMVFYFDRRE